MPQKVTNPAKIVTDGMVLRELARQGVDKDYVEFFRDYCSRSKGGSPYAKFYRDLKSGKQFMVVSSLPMVKPDGTRIEVGWLFSGGKYYSRANLFSSIVQGTEVKLTCLSDQPYGAKKDEQTTWNPQLFVDGVEQKPASGEPTLLETDPTNQNYHHNVLEWDYGICKRRIRIIEGRFRERWLFYANPDGDVRIKHNFAGNHKVKLDYARDAKGNPLEVVVTDDEELVPAGAFAKAAYPVEIGAEQTFYPDADPETSSVDGFARHYIPAGDTWATIRNAAGDLADDTADDAYASYIYSDDETDKWRCIARGIFLFDTSGLPDDATITAATLSLRGSYKQDALGINPEVNIYSSAPASNTALVAGDYDCGGSTPYCDTDLTYASWSTAGYNDFALNATGLAAILKTGVSKFGGREVTYDVGASDPAWSSVKETFIRFWSADKGAGYKPKLLVTCEDPNKTSSDSGSGVESLGSRLFGAAEVGSGTGASSLLAALIGTEETGLGSEFAAKIFSVFDSGAGIDAVIARLLAATEAGSSVEAALLITALISGDGGVGSDLSTSLKDILAADEGSGFEALKALIETTGSDMRLSARPGQVRIPSKGVNL